jgi:parallel beta-helix repeat protein
MRDKGIWKILAILIAFVVASCITPCIAVVSDSTDNIGYLNKIEQYRTSEDRIIEVNTISCISSSSADGVATSGISKLYIINHHLSEYPPSSRLIEGKRFIYDNGDYWTWGNYSLKGDISGTSYSYRLWLGSDSSTTFKIEIIINGATVATFPLLTVPYDPYYQPFSGNVTGLDPTTSSGDEVILKITKISGGAGSILYFGSAASSYITIPPLATQPIQSIQSMIDAAKPGDTIIIEDGIYNENVKVNKRLTIRSENGTDKTIIQAAKSNDHVFGITADYVNISGFTVKGATGWGKAGIYLGIGVDHCNISGNTALNNNRGILLYCSNNNNVTKNNATNNDIGIYLNSYSSNNTLINNTVNSNSDFGIVVAFSSNNTLINNTISNSRHGVRLYLSHNNKINSCNFEKDGFSISHSYENEIKDCYVNGKPLIYLEDEKDKTINYAGQVILINSRNITIKGCNLSDTSMGIILDGSSRITVSNNGICDNNLCGIYFNDSSNNYIYLNNFVNNSDNVCSYRSTNIWNLTEKITYTYNGKNYENSLGNYWSDYAGSDLNEDGIGDTPYSIDSDKDNYPLIELFENYFAPTVPTCKIELQKNGVKIDKIGVGEWFNIVITEYSGDIKKVRFLSDESQNGKVDECFTWTEWYDWNTSKEDRTGHWYASNKTKTWAFATSGEKEVWAEVKDGEGRTAYCHAGIYASSTPTPKTIYVPDDYSKIQWAVNNASAGDTIIVRDGTYCENVVVDKSLTIKSENGAEYTTIDGGGSGDVVKITANNVTIEGFTITGGSDWYAGLCIGSSGNKIISNKISNNWWGINRVSNNNQILNNNCSNNDWDGIALSGSNNIIANNNCSNNDWDGIDLSGSNNIISNNNCSNNGVNGIDLFGSNNNTITDSIASNNHVGGIQLAFSNNNTISNNTCSNNNKGIYLVHSNNNSIYLNSFIKNVDNVRSSYSTNIWNSTEKITYTYNETTCTNYLGNYWDDYEGNDANGDGIGDTSYTIDRDKDDCYPLMERFENYLPKSSSHEENAYSHLYEVMDKYNEFFDVYTGGDAAGNHYIPSGWMGDWNDLTFNGSYIIDPHSGPNCIKVTYSADFYENNHYIPSGWMGDWNDITFNDSYTSDPHSGANCIKINYSANGSQGNNWSGIYWQDPENNWGDKIGGFNLTGAAELTFWAKGEKGGEKMEFKVGGINRHAYNVYTDKNAANNHYFPSGWYNGASNMLFNDNWMDNPHSGTSCIKVTWNGAAGNDGWKWNGVMWQNPENNLAGDSGYGYNLTGATKLTFWARTDEPGLKVKFLMGYPADTSGEVLINERTDGWVELYTNWTQYEIDLSGRDLSDIAGGFAFVFNDVNDPDPDGCTFYLDDIKYDKVTLYDLDKPYQDSCGPVSSGLITLTNNWQRYAINLTNENLSHIIGGFCGVANKDNNPEGCAFYLDDIKYEYKYGDKSFNVYTDAQQNWAGIYWQDPENNWGNCSEGGYNLTGATNLSFWAKGANGTEKIEFKIGGIGWDPKTDQQIARYPDSLHPAVSTGIINLTTEWKQYTVDLTGRDF